MTDIADLAGGIPLTNGDVTMGSLLAAVADDVIQPQTETELTSNYAPTDGRVAVLTATDEVFVGDGSSWLDVDHDLALRLAGLPGATVVSTSDDLPAASGGVRTLEDGEVYLFTDYVTDSATLRMGDPSPLIGWHGGAAGYIHTGGSAAVKTDGEPFLMRDMYLHAPGGTAFDLTAPDTVDMLVESHSTSNAAGIANVSSLGTIDGYRVPSFKGCNFEEFGSGLEFDGSPDKIFISECPVRNVDGSGVKLFTLKSTCSVEAIDFVDNYVKNVQSDTEVLHVEAGGEPSDVLQYRGTLHDTTVTLPSNAVTGALDTASVGVRVSDSYPLTDWAINGDLDLDGAVTISSPTSPTEVAGSNLGGETTTLSAARRTSKPVEGRVQYDAKDTAITRVFLIISLTASQTTASVFIGKNGDDIERSQSLVETQGSGQPVTVPATTNLELTTGDYISAYVRNDDGSGDIEVETLALTLGPA